ERERLRLLQRGLNPEDLKNELEMLNIGRLRMASKGVDRDPRFGRDAGAPKLRTLDEDEQWSRGMYMIGQVAALRSEPCTLEELHREVSYGSVERLATVAMPALDDLPAAPPPADIAIVGMGCIMPAAPDLRTY